MIRSTLFAIAALAALPCHAAVDVTFINPEKYTDAANQRWELDANLKTLADHIRKSGARYIGADETLKVEVLDVDLAGWSRWGRQGANEVRVARGGADFPQMHLRYSLQSPSRAKSGEADLRDLAYQNRGLRTRAADEPMYYEKRMIDDWLRNTFARR